jgi:hypothetical protein
MNTTSWQDQIICGTLLGSGYISKTNPTYLGISETHCRDWLLYKGMELQSLEARTPLSESGKVLKWRSKSGDLWNIYKDIFYKDGKKHVEMDTLDRLRGIAFAVWFGDKGFWYSSRRIGLRSTAFGDCNKIFSDFFNEVGMSCSTKTDSHGAVRIIFDRKGTIEFLSTIAHRLPDFMHHRLISPLNPIDQIAAR